MRCVRVILHESSQSEVSNLHQVVVAHKTVARRQISEEEEDTYIYMYMYVQTREAQIAELSACGTHLWMKLFDSR